jgi:hypothetical protein
MKSSQPSWKKILLECIKEREKTKRCEAIFKAKSKTILPLYQINPKYLRIDKIFFFEFF